MLFLVRRFLHASSTKVPLPSQVAVEVTAEPPVFSKHAQLALHRMDKQNHLISRFISILTKTGDKQPQMEELVAESLHILRLRTNQQPEVLFGKAIDMLAPVVECRSFKRGAKNIRVPIPLTEARAQGHAMRWIKRAVEKKRRPFVQLPERL
jgi:ribosomal protein S7